MEGKETFSVYKLYGNRGWERHWPVVPKFVMPIGGELQQVLVPGAHPQRLTNMAWGVAWAPEFINYPQVIQMHRQVWEPLAQMKGPPEQTFPPPRPPSSPSLFAQEGVPRVWQWRVAPTLDPPSFPLFPALCWKSYTSCPAIIYVPSSKTNNQMSHCSPGCASPTPPPIVSSPPQFPKLSFSCACITWPENFHLCPLKSLLEQNFNLY